MRHLLRALTWGTWGTCVLGSVFWGPALCQAAPFTSTNRTILSANTGAFPIDGVQLGSTRFINRGLQGVGRIAANSIDAATGESLGSISDMQIHSFARQSDGSYTGVFEFLPDRGYNSGSVFSNYAARINTFDFSFNPHTSSATTTAQNQILSTFRGSTRFTYDHDANSATPGIYTTGLLANGVGTLLGRSIPVVTGNTTQSDGTFAGRMTVDAEGFVLDNRAGQQGTGWLSDEYGPNIYRFNANKEIVGVLGLPEAVIPHTSNGTTIDYSSDPPSKGRRTNQGMEGLAQSPSGNRLFGLLQSALVQDSGTGNVGRSNTRLLVYDLSDSDVPTGPSEQYVIQLPLIDDNGSTGGAVANRTGAQSAILALNDHQILILSREGNGRGASGAPVFKSILLADLNGATNIDGLYDGGLDQVAPSGVLRPAITPLSWVEALNLLGKLDLNITELEQFGINLNTAPGDINTISEKWEALSLVSALDPTRPHDYFLFVGNDNDFTTRSGVYMKADGTLGTYDSTIDNDSMILAFRVSAVPEPGAVLLSLVGLAGLLRLRRRGR